MKNYEIMFIVRPDVDEATVKGTVKSLEKILTDHKAKITLSKELGQKEMDLYKPIMEKAQAAIKKVAKEKGFNYVLDSTTGSGVLVADGTDLLADVKKSLGF